MSDNERSNPCGDFGPVQKNAVIWFISALILGGALTAVFSRIDRSMFDSNAQILDFEVYEENRRAASSIPSESVDPRVLSSTLPQEKH